MKNKQLSTIANETYSSRIIIINTSSRFFSVCGTSIRSLPKNLVPLYQYITNSI